MDSESATSPDETILTDICSKSSKTITYTNRGTVVSIQKSKSDFFGNISVLIKDIFLPKGYPESVSSDYLEYQIWDTCQAFCSSISGTLAMRAVLQGIGVGSETATPVSAAVTWLLKDGTGMIGSILFAWFKGSKFDSDCKKWRLFADILNDIALFIELYVPYILDYSMYVLCISTVLKAVVGTAGSSTRAALITHQAIKGNTADVSAKDGSQEIFTNLCAFIFGIFLLKNVTETEQIWIVMCTATLFHLIFNIKAVRCLKINVFNSQRFCLCLRTYFPTSVVPTVEQINNRESVFLSCGISDKEICGFSIVFGSCLQKAMKSPELTTAVFSAIMNLFRNKNYLIIPHLRSKKLYVTFCNNINTESDVLKAYFHASLLGISINYLQKNKNLCVMSRCRRGSPMNRLRNILKEFLTTDISSTTDKISELLLLAYATCEDFMEKEFSAFNFACECEDWDLKKHLINIGDWRSDWKSHESQRKQVYFTADEVVTQRKSSPQSQSSQKPMQALIIS